MEPPPPDKSRYSRSLSYSGSGDGDIHSMDLEYNIQRDVSQPLMNDSWLGKPVEEVDPLIFDDTFCVISDKFGHPHIHRYSCTKSLFLFGPLSPTRRFAIYVTTHRWFEFFMIFTILCNCVTLAMVTNMFDPITGEKILHSMDYYVNYLEYAFLTVYTIEVILKVLSKGLVLNKYSFMRNRWNLLDLIVVISGYHTLILDLNTPGQKEDNDLDFLRTVRVLRVCKTISILPGLKMMINALLNAVVQLFDVMVLTIFWLMIFSLFAMELFEGRLRQKCVVDKGGYRDPDWIINRPISEEPFENRDQVWTEWVNDWNNWLRRDFPIDEPVFCGNGSDKRPCPEGYTCIGNLGEHPDNGWTSFDSFFSSMFSTFVLLTTDYWERPYDIIISTCGIWTLPFLLVTVFLGAFYLLNLMLTVVTIAYEGAVTEQDQGEISAPDRLALNRNLSNFSFDELIKLNVCKITNYRTKRTDSERERLTKRFKMLTSGEEEPGPHDKQNVQHLNEAIFSLLGMRMALDQGKAKSRGGSLIEEAVMKAAEEEGFTVNTNPQQTPSRKPVDNPGRPSNMLGVGSASDSDVEVDLMHKVSSRFEQLAPSVIKYKSRLKDCLGKYLRPIVNHWIFESFITICIIMNMLALSAEHHGQTQKQEYILQLANNTFMAVFTVEMILKLMALHREYFHTGWNIFDMIIVVVSYVDFGIGLTLNGTRNSGLRVIRSMRLLRVFKLAQSWVTMKVLLNIIFSSLGALGNVILVLLIVIYIFAVMGMQMIGEKFKQSAFPDNKLPDWHWGNFWYAFNLVFRILCGEWIEALRDCLLVQAHYIKGKSEAEQNHFLPYFKCFMIYVPILVVGNYIVLNLFLALLLNSFDTEELNAQRDKELEAKGKAEEMRNIVGLLMARRGTIMSKADIAIETPEEPYAEPLRRKSRVAGGFQPSREKPVEKPSSKKIVIAESKARKRFKSAVRKVIIRIRIDAAERAIARMENRHKKDMTLQKVNKTLLGNPAMKNRDDESYLEYDDTPETSVHSEEITGAAECFPSHIFRYRFCPCKPRSKRDSLSAVVYRWEMFRSVCAAIVGHYLFQSVILILIFASSITLCFEDINLDDNPKFREILCYINFAFTAIFCLEMILKWFALGIWGYFTSFWTLLDAFIVVVGLVSMSFDLEFNTCDSSNKSRTGASSNWGSLKALSTLRALRPLRAISRWEGMKIVVNALFYAIPSIFNVLLVCLLFWLIFAIIGVQFFKGQFYRCVDSNGDRVPWVLAPNKDVCCSKVGTNDYTWINTISNFDNVFEGYLSLLQIATFEGWMELIGYSVDATGVDSQPITHNQIWAYAFNWVFIVFGSFFSLRLLVGVIIDNFNTLKKKYEGNMLEIMLTTSQRNWYIAMKHLGKTKPKPILQRPKTQFAGFFYDLATSRKLEVVIFIMIFFNMVTEAFDHYGDRLISENRLDGFNVVYSAIYVLEALIKILGLGTFYFTIPWNVYDFILVGASTMDTIIGISTSLPVTPTILRVVRVFRIGRILRLVKSAKGIRKLMFALVVSLPALFNIGALLSLIIFIYAILGMNLFGRAPRKWSLDDVFNFETFTKSCLMLLRLAIAAGWNEVLDSLTMIEPECGTYRHLECGDEGEPDCPNRALVLIYMITFLILTFFIVINLYIAIILENYVDASNEEDVGIVEDDLEMFYIRWSRFDPQATQFINFSDLQEFLECLDPPLQFKKPNIFAIVVFNLPIARGNKLHCLDILQALITHVLGEVDDSKEFRKLQHQMEHKFQRQFPTRRLLDIVSSTRRWKMEQNAVIIIQRAWRAHWRRIHPSKSKNISVSARNPKVVRKSMAVKISTVPSSMSHGGMGHMMNRVGNVPEKDKEIGNPKQTKSATSNKTLSNKSKMSNK